MACCLAVLNRARRRCTRRDRFSQCQYDSTKGWRRKPFFRPKTGAVAPPNLYSSLAYKHRLTLIPQIMVSFLEKAACVGQGVVDIVLSAAYQCGLKVLPVSIRVFRRESMRGQPSAVGA